MAQNKKAKKKDKKKAPNWSTGVVENKIVEKNYFLMLEKEVDASAVIDHLKEKDMDGLDVWPAMNVFMIEIVKDHGIEFECIDVEETFVHPSDHAFIKNRNIKTVFEFRTSDDQVEALKPYFSEIVAEFGGFACTDSEDFQPMIDLA